MRFDWDENKAAANEAKHGVSFDEAQEAFDDPNCAEGFDAAHSDEETRFWLIGLSSRRLLTVVYAERQENVIRLISAREATARERKMYESSGEERDDF